MNKEEKRYLTKAMEKVSHKGIVVEVGSYIGISAQRLSRGILKYKRKAKFYCIDTFKGTKGLKPNGHGHSEMYYMYRNRDVQAIFEKNMREYPHKTLVMDSIEAAKLFNDESIDFLFLDANHFYRAVKADSKAWWPKIKEGGRFTGHDYHDSRYGVKKAIDELFGNKVKVVARTIWEVQK